MNKDRATLGLIIGLIAGVPISYVFQPALIRAKLTLGAYLVNLPELLSKYPGDLLLPVMISCALCAGVGWFVGGRTGGAA